MEEIVKEKHGFIFYLWVFMICSVFGSVWEILWYFIRYLSYSNRTAFVFGYWNVLYGMGGVIMTAVLIPFRKKGGLVIFLISVLAGSIIELLASIGQEIVFGATSWNYSKYPFNLFGKINVLYSIFWGIIGYLWMRFCYPRVAVLEKEVPREISYTILVFLIFNALASIFATLRWKVRVQGNGFSDSLLERFLDFFFNDDALSFVYPNWHFHTP